MDVQSWLAANRKKLANKWELLFVNEILGHSDEVDFAYLNAQEPFKDLEGKNRYIDFSVKEGERLRIAIEVDGYDKRGSGSGMTHDEFIDWEKRQNSLSAQGWTILRFANRQVRDTPAECIEHIDLLLREKRHEMSHHQALHKNYISIQKKLDEANRAVNDAKSGYENEIRIERNRLRTAQKEQPDLERQLNDIRRKLTLAENAKGLSAIESKRLEELEIAQNRIEILETEGKLMKTTIWAFTVIIISGMVLAAVFLTDTNTSKIRSETENRVAASQDAPTAAIPTSPAGSSCENPISWGTAKLHLGKTKAISGPVRAITFREQTRGQPTWINIGANFPDESRLELVIWGRNRPKFENILSRIHAGNEICAIGKVSEYRGIVQIELSSASQLRF